MNVLIYRGYIGFQPLAVTSEISHSFTTPIIESFIKDGILYLPISSDDLDQDDLGNQGAILSSYLVSNKLYSRWLQIDERGMADNIFIKDSAGKEKSSPSYRRVPLSIAHSTSAVLVQNRIDGEYLGALVHADATLDQIDSFCQEFLIGSYNPFVWTKIDHVNDLINKSKRIKTEFPYRQVREGPSKYVLELEVQKIMDDVKDAVRTAKNEVLIQKKKIIKRKVPVKKRKTK